MVDDKICFVICPIGDEDSLIRKHSDLTLNYIIRPVVESFGYKLLRADLINEPGKITTQIIDQIVESSLVIADLTEHNPNVFYELAIRHIVKKPYIQMMKSDHKVPFDFYDVRTIPFETNLKQGTEAKKMLEDQIKTIENGDFKPHNVITSAKNYSTIKRMVDEGGQIELGNLSKDFFNSFSELNSKISKMESKISELTTPLNHPTYRKDDEIERQINLLENQRNVFKRTYNELKNNKAPRHELKEYEIMISTIDKQLDHLENQLF